MIIFNLPIFRVPGSMLVVPADNITSPAISMDERNITELLCYVMPQIEATKNALNDATPK